MKISVSKSLLASVSLLLVGGIAQAQTNNTAQTQISPAELAATIKNSEVTQNSDSLLLTYGEAVTDPTLARVAIGQLLTSYYQLRNLAQTSDQATQAVAEATLRFMVLQSAQNQVIIQQNQQLLDQNARLLEILARQQAPAPTR